MTVSPRKGRSPAKAANAAQAKSNGPLVPPALPSLSKVFELAHLITTEPERLAQSDSTVSSLSIDTLKQIFDYSVLTEKDAIKPLSSFIESITPDSERTRKRTTRSAGKRKRGQQAPAPSSAPLFESTPLDELVTDGMDSRQIWEQIDLKSAKMATFMEKYFIQEAAEEEEEDDDDDEKAEQPRSKGRPFRYEEDEDEEDHQDSDEDEDNDDESGEEQVKLSDLSDADLRALGIDPAMRDQLLAYDDGEQDSDEEGSAYAGASDISDGDPTEVFFEPLKSEAQQLRRKEEQEMSALPRLRSQVQSELEEQEESEGEQYAAMDEDDEDEQDSESHSNPRKGLLQSLDEPGSNVSKKRTKRHPTLDDDFFSIDALNQQLDEQDAAEDDDPLDDNDDDDLTNEVDYFKPLSGEDDRDEESIDEDGDPDALGADEVHYADFFLPPEKAAKFNKKFGGRKASARFAKQDQAQTTMEEEDDDDEESENDASLPSLASSPETPDRKRRIRFNDTIEFRRIKSRKKADHGLTPEMLKMLGASEDDIAAAQEDDDDEDDDDDDDMDMDEVESETSSVGYDQSDDETDGEQDAQENENADENNSDAEKSDPEDGGDDDEVKTAQRVAGDLFADSDDEETEAKLSTHEKRVAALREEIKRLEQENVGKKDWTVMGEAGSRARPQDSLLEQDLDFERASKVTPQMTEEITESMENLIKRRILDGQFDDVIRRREMEALPFLPSRLLELSDSKSAKSLAELYEEEYQAARGVSGQADPSAPVGEADAKLAKEHQALTELYDDIFNKLDALSNAHFTPKAPKATIQTLSNVPAASIESSLPATSSSSTMLAPEEVYERTKHASSIEGTKSEMTPEDKQRLHNTLRKEKKHRNEKIQDTRKALEQSGLVRAKKVNATEEKQDALKKLVSNRGVSVIGKDTTATGPGTGKKQKSSPHKKGTSTSDTKATSGNKFKL